MIFEFLQALSHAMNVAVGLALIVLFIGLIIGTIWTVKEYL